MPEPQETGDRTPAQLEKDVIAGFAKIGVKW